MDFWHTGELHLDVSSHDRCIGTLPGIWNRVLTSHTATVSYCTSHPTKTSVYASAGLQGEVFFWHAKTKACLGAAYIPAAAATSLAFSQCGNLFAMGLVNGALEVCDKNRVRQYLFTLFKDKVNDIKFSPDGRWMAAGSDDTTVVLFSCHPQLHPITRCRGHAAAVMSLDWSEDSLTLQTVCRYIFRSTTIT